MPPIRPELPDELLKDYQKPEDLLGQDGLLQQLTKALVERALGGELTHHLGGFPEAIEAVFPQTQVQLCMVHLVRHSLSYVSHKDRKAVADGLKEIYQAVTAEEAERQLAQFEETWAASYPVIARSWRQNWSRVVPMFSYPPEIRRAVYTTNTIESLNMTLRKVSKNRPLFPSDEAVFKLLYLALRNISKRWTMTIPNRSGALNQFAILFDGRVPMGGLSSSSLTQNT
jgi:putative transposase